MRLAELLRLVETRALAQALSERVLRRFVLIRRETDKEQGEELNNDAISRVAAVSLTVSHMESRL